MGQYLSIGIVHRIRTDKERAVRHFKSIEAVKNAMQKQFNPNSIYHLEETEGGIVLQLDKDIAEKEWKDFILHNPPHTRSHSGDSSRLQ